MAWHHVLILFSMMDHIFNLLSLHSLVFRVVNNTAALFVLKYPAFYYRCEWTLVMEYVRSTSTNQAQKLTSQHEFCVVYKITVSHNLFLIKPLLPVFTIHLVHNLPFCLFRAFYSSTKAYFFHISLTAVWFDEILLKECKGWVLYL